MRTGPICTIRHFDWSGFRPLIDAFLWTKLYFLFLLPPDFQRPFVSATCERGDLSGRAARVSCCNAVPARLVAMLFCAWIISAGSAPASAFGFPDCHFTAPPPSSGFGERLALADRLETEAAGYDDYNYELCWRVGLDCPNVVDRDFRTSESDPSRERCLFAYASPNWPDFEEWKQQRTVYNKCISDDLRRRAREIRDAVWDEQTAPDIEDVLAGLAETPERPLAADETAAIATDTTWCGAAGSQFRSSIQCAGGGMVILKNAGEQRLSWRVDGAGRLCFDDFQDSESCHEVWYNRGRFELAPRHTMIGTFTVVEGVESGRWHSTCGR